MDVMDIESVYNRYFKDVFKFTLGLCGNYALAEEITQSAETNIIHICARTFDCPLNK